MGFEFIYGTCVKIEFIALALANILTLNLSEERKALLSFLLALGLCTCYLLCLDALLHLFLLHLAAYLITSSGNCGQTQSLLTGSCVPSTLIMFATMPPVHQVVQLLSLSNSRAFPSPHK